MASHLSNIYGSEQDKVNCSFYLKIGACRHGERCSRKHIKPTFSQTLVIANMYQNPAHDPNCKLSETELTSYFETFYEDVFCELVKYGNLLEMHVCDNVGDHLIGNVYARYDWEDEAQIAVDAFNQRWYAGRPLFAELSPVTDFREACCRQNDMGECNRGGFCNFMHLKEPRSTLVRELHAQQRVERKLNPSERDQERAKEMAEFSRPNDHHDHHNGDDHNKRSEAGSPRPVVDILANDVDYPREERS
ncbi:hypothetical protein MJO29_012191 [Puccinia striiformis f. sp. tritici]|uniref:Splicing factor U2AF 23 kDa subunit n=1 Tax=Puccinia striiformis TaxID=27350 RepID=A0A2S4WK08_9BASI|nr:hypothetical protein Pst134EA_022878 [Puccinia striiformis f. sp. tritici]KAH9455410.1 hypothetical protein Pst134EA_022878 [Puccinia striiformis f. sp. tritici]KAI7945803.1 hypothetical protein MJO29_012191 [Puccinia striiformis f. sp. tritici]KAI9611836.1 hypothetical protein KEM48_004343 [Puccinia striiformis f. sp. tritici PST-130]POW22089.1 hypothetical protein PSHT_01698 [Puccinia striiformis]